MTTEQENEISRSEVSDKISLPDGFLDRMRKLLGEEEYKAFLSSYGRERLFSLRISPLKCSREMFAELAASWLEAGRAGKKDMKDAEALLEAGTPGASREEDRKASEALLGAGAPRKKETESSGKFNLETEGFSPVPWEPDGFYYPESFRPGRLPWHEAGMYYIQEASAMLPGMLCGARPGERVLDLCAAPGGKSTKLAADLRGQGLLVANEIHPDRARVLSSNIERMGVRNALVTNASPQELATRFPLFFDRIVVDAPCSGEGMFRKEEEALRHWSLENIRICAARQDEILEEAASMLRPGGQLVYSTCTFAPEENEGTIARFLANHPEFSVVSIVQKCQDWKTEEWGFDPGRPEWVFAFDNSAEGDRGQTPVSLRPGLSGAAAVSAVSAAEGNVGDLERLSSIIGAIRLWPHRLEGEGHFAAVLQKTGGEKDRSGFALAEAAEPGEAGKSLVAQRSDHAGEKTERNRAGSKKGGKKKGKGSRKAGRMDSKDADLIELWNQFRAETLTEEFVLAGEPGRGQKDIFFPDRAPGENLFCFGDTLYALPVSREILPLEGLRVLRAGLQLGTATKGRFVPSHSLGMALRGEEAQRVVDLAGCSEAAYAWLRGEALPLPPEASGWKGWVLVTIDGCAAGWGKAAGAMLKNHYPKGLRKGSGYRYEQ